MDIEILPLGEEHLDEVCRMEEEAFSQPWHRESFQEMIGREDACYLAALLRDSSRAVACAGLREIAGEGEITNVVTARGFRGRGIARALLTRLLEEGKKRGLTAFSLEVRCSNEAAIRLYGSLGFRKEGRRKDFYAGPKEDALIMWKR